MPRIPIYKRQVELATGALSRAPNEGAFTAPSRAVQNFAKTAENIAFNFGNAEKQAIEKTESLAAQEDVISKVNDTILKSKATDTATAQGEVNSVVNKAKNKLKTNKNLTESMRKSISLRLDEIGLQKSTIAKQSAFKKGRVLESEKNNNLMLKILESTKILSKESPLFEVNKKNVKKLYEDSYLNGSNIGLTYKTFDEWSKALSKESVAMHILNKDFDKAEKEITGSNLTSTQKLVQKSVLEKQKTKIYNETYINLLENLDDYDYSSQDVENIQNSLEKNRPFTYTLENGQNISIDPKKIGTQNKIKLSGFLQKKSKEYTEKQQNESYGTINNLPHTSPNLFGESVLIATGSLSDEKAQDVLYSSAVNAYNKADSMIQKYTTNPSGVDLEMVNEELSKSKYLLETQLRGNKLLNTLTYGDKSGDLIVKITKLENSLKKEQIEMQRLNIGINAVKSGTFEFVADQYSQSDTEKITEISLANQNKDIILQRIQANNLVHKPYKTLLQAGVTEGQGPFSDEMASSVEGKVLLYKEIKLLGDKVLSNYTDLEDQAFYEAVILNNDMGFSMSESIKRVSDAWQTGVPVTKFTKDALQVAQLEVKDKLESFFGKGDNIHNLSSINVQAEKYMEFLSRYGTNKDKIPVKAAEAIINSYQNINGHLIRKLNNLPTDFQVKTDLITDEFKKTNTEYEDEEMALIPAYGRADKYFLYSNGMLVSNIVEDTIKQGKRETVRIKTTFSKEDINKLSAEIKKNKNMTEYTKNKIKEKNKKFLEAEALVSGQAEVIEQRFP